MESDSRVTTNKMTDPYAITQAEEKFYKFYPLFCELLVVRQHLYLV
jgi:hypothetical protein